MDNNQALDAVIARLDALGNSASLKWDEVQQWPEGVLNSLVSNGLLTKGVNANSLQCTGCENHCFMNVVLADDESKRAFIVCDHPEMQSQMGRINVPAERLKQWQCSPKHLALVIADLLGFESKPEYQKESGSFKLGMSKGSKGRRWVVLQTQPLALVVNRYSVPLVEMLYFEDAIFQIDMVKIAALVDAKPPESGKAYTPNLTKREANKLLIQVMYQNWNDEYLRLKLEHPGKTDTWRSIQIAKMSISQGKDSETIRKNMKK
jgi:hypothetical protein